MRRTKSKRSIVAQQSRNAGLGLKRAFSQRRQPGRGEQDATAAGKAMHSSTSTTDSSGASSSSSSAPRRKRRSAYFASQRAEVPVHRIRPVEDFDFDALRIENPYDQSQPSLAATKTKKALLRLRKLFRA